MKSGTFGVQVLDSQLEVTQVLEVSGCCERFSMEGGAWVPRTLRCGARYFASTTRRTGGLVQVTETRHRPHGQSTWTNRVAGVLFTMRFGHPNGRGGTCTLDSCFFPNKCGHVPLPPMKQSHSKIVHKHAQCEFVFVM